MWSGFNYPAETPDEPTHVPWIARGRREDDATVAVQQVTIDVEVEADRAVITMSAVSADGAVRLGGNNHACCVAVTHSHCECLTGLRRASARRRRAGRTCRQRLGRLRCFFGFAFAGWCMSGKWIVLLFLLW